jgi:hypothetical protein
MSDRLQRQLALADAEEQREARQAEHQRAGEAESWRERAFQAAVAEAVENGESMQDALAGRNLGHTPQEFIDKVNAQCDFEDSMAEARQANEFRKWQQSQTADTSADVSDVEAEAAKWKQYDTEHGADHAERKARRRETRKMIRSHDRLKQMGLGGV